MKKHKIIYLLILFASAVYGISCKKYLEKTPVADISEKDVFTSFDTYQGYVETMYDDIVDWVHLTSRFAEFNWGDDIIPTRTQGFIEGDYFFVIASSGTNANSPFYNIAATRASGAWNNNLTRRQAIWQNSWFGIRAANVALAHLNDLVDATEEQKRFIEGQAYFFRGYFHWEMMKAWGAVPYVDTVFAADDDMRIPQMDLYATSEKVLADLQKAADLLPVDWDQTATGQLTLGINRGRATKGMALSVKAECLLFNASPLFNGVATGSYTYNAEYCKKAAEAAWQVIEIANQGVYALEPWATYSSIFFTKNNAIPHSREIIFKHQQRGNARYFTSSFTFGNIGTDSWFSAPTQNYVELFETANGLPVDDPASGFDPADPWTGRDPRFRYNILVDNDRLVTSLNDARAFAQLYVGGREKGAPNSLTGFGYRKYWDETLNIYDNGWNNYFYEVPKLRLAEIYLIYAEAANEAYGPDGRHPGAGITSAEAVNIVRARANMPGVDAKFTANKEDFRARVWNERAVELAYESKRWYDLRRWHVAHLPQYRELFGLEFDKDHTYFKRTLIKTIEFSEKHYWLPFPTAQVSLYPEWKQNPGW